MVKKKSDVFIIKVAKSEVDETIRVLKQTGNSNALIDKQRIAKLPGKRISKTGKVYWETRKNRSDAPLKRI